MTGLDLVERLRRAASAEGESLSRFVRPLATDPHKFINQLSDSRKPTPITIERVNALIEGRPIPPHRNGHVRMPKSNGLTRLEAEALGLPPSERSIVENRSLQIAIARKRHEFQMRELSHLARETRRPGQPLGDRLRELRREMAA